MKDLVLVMLLFLGSTVIGPAVELAVGAEAHYESCQVKLEYHPDQKNTFRTLIRLNRCIIPVTATLVGVDRAGNEDVLSTDLTWGYDHCGMDPTMPGKIRAFRLVERSRRNMMRQFAPVAQEFCARFTGPFSTRP